MHLNVRLATWDTHLIQIQGYTCVYTNSDEYICIYVYIHIHCIHVLYIYTYMYTYI